MKLDLKSEMTEIPTMAMAEKETEQLLKQDGCDLVDQVALLIHEHNVHQDTIKIIHLTQKLELLNEEMDTKLD